MKTISFVIPVYNESERLVETFKALKELSLPPMLKLDEVIFVDDGSSDGTHAILMRSKKLLESYIYGAKLNIISYKKNKGKGYAVKVGMKAATSDFLLLFDADVSTPLTELVKFAPFLGSARVIIGTRKNGKSTVVKHQPKLRELLGITFTKITQVALRCEVSDFTCGFKLFSKDAYIELAKVSVINRWGYDAELIYLAQKFGFDIVEIPVIWSNDERTKVKLYKAVPETLSEIARIIFEHDIKPNYKRHLMSSESEYKLNLEKSVLRKVSSPVSLRSTLNLVLLLGAKSFRSRISNPFYFVKPYGDFLRRRITSLL